MMKTGLLCSITALVSSEYQTFEGKTCWAGHGAIEIDSDASAPSGMSVDTCEDRCDEDSSCDCVSFRPSDGKCWKRSACNLNQCGADALYNTYVKGSSPPSPPSPPGPSPSPSPQGYQVFEGKTCWNGHGAVEIDSDASAPSGMSVDTCEDRCNDDSSCDCVSFRPSDGKCWKRMACNINQCGADALYNTYVKGSSPSPPGPPPAPSPLCPDSSVTSPQSDWLWDRDTGYFPSCTSPSVQNTAQQCDGDPTSVVLQAHGNPECLATKMSACKFDMHGLTQLDFDMTMQDCLGTWAAPLWLTPDYWRGGGASGEIDMVELCPTDAIYSNFAGGGKNRAWPHDPNSFSGHVTMVIENGEVAVDVCTNVGGQCQITDGGAKYENIFGANGCKDHDCVYTFISDIWNGNSGDGGYSACAGGHTHAGSQCAYSIRNIRIKASEGTIPTSCSALMSGASSAAAAAARPFMSVV